MPDDIDAVTDCVGKVPNHNGAEPDAAAVPDHIYTMPRDTGTEPDVVFHMILVENLIVFVQCQRIICSTRLLNNNNQHILIIKES